MENEYKIIRGREYWLSLFSVLSLYLWGMKDYLDENNAFYAIEHYNLYDNELFSKSLVLSAGGISPRYLLNYIMLFLMKITGGNWLSACIVVIYFGVVVLAVATTEIVVHLSKKNQLFLTIALGFLLMSSINCDMCNWTSFYVHSVGIGTSFALALLAISQVLGNNKNWNFAWTILAVAAVFHIHEGMYGFCVLFLIYIINCVDNKRIDISKEQCMFILFFAVMLICALPALSDDSISYSNREFVNVYAKELFSFHLDPDYWGMEKSLFYLLSIIFSAIIRLVTIYTTDKKKCKKFIFEASLFIGTLVLAFFIQYVIVNWLPSITLITLYIPKYFKYVGVMSLLWNIESVRDWLHNKAYALAGIVYIGIIVASKCDMVGLIISNIVVICYILAVFYCNKRWLEYGIMIFLWGIIIIAFPVGRKTFIALSIFIMLSGLYELFGRFRKILLAIPTIIILSVGMLIVSLQGKVWQIDGKQVSFVSQNSMYTNIIGEERYKLAIDFKDTTTKDASFICDYDEKYIEYFQCISQRSSYCNRKTAITQASLLDELIIRWAEVTNLYSNSINDIVEIMNKNNIQYCYVNKKDYDKFLDSNFEIYLKSSNDNYRIYKLIGD